MKIILVCLLLVNMSLYSATMRVYNKSDQTIQVVIHNDIQKIEPGKSVWFNSGFNPIRVINFNIPGRVGPITWLANIGTFEVEQKIEYYSPKNIKKL